MFKNKTEFKKEFTRRLVESYGCTVEETHITEKYVALAKMVRDYANVNWRDTKVAAKQADAREIYYFSIEFLIGRMLTSNLKNLGIYDMVVEGLDELGIDYHELSEYELDPGLGQWRTGKIGSLLYGQRCFFELSAEWQLHPL
jgi:starch phosphorylase